MKNYSTIIHKNVRKELTKLITEVIKKQLGEEVVSVPNDPNVYKREGVNFYIANVGIGNKPNLNTKWVQITDQNKIRYIEKTIFKGQSGTYLQQGNTISKNKWIGCKNGFVGGAVKIIGDKPFPKGLFSVGNQVNITGYKNNLGAKIINGFAKIKSIDPNLKGIVVDKPWPSSIKGIKDECAVVSKVESNIVNNAKKCGWGSDTKGYVNSGYECPKRSEMQKIADTKKKYYCVPIEYVWPIKKLKDSKASTLLLKATLGIIGRESDFGGGDSIWSKKYWSYGVKSALKNVKSRFDDYTNDKTSLGPGQITKDTAKKYGIDSNDLNTVSTAVKGVYKILLSNYNIAIKNGYSTNKPSSNFTKGTGNAALDLAIGGHNLGEGKMTKYCETSNPKIKNFCSFAGQIKDGVTVYNKPVANYLPNYGTSLTTHNYVAEVARRMKGFSCVDNA